MTRGFHGQGMRSNATLLVTALLGLGWLGWPIWSSFTAPNRDDTAAEFPFLLAAVLALLALLSTTIWLDANRRAAVFGPVLLLAVVDVVFRLVLSPGGAGIEPVYALPLVAGAALGAPAGFLTGALAALASSMALGLVDTPLVSQILVWGIWGAVGGLLRPLRPVIAWILGVLAAVPLGLISGVALNIMGWTGDGEAVTGGFLPGLPPWEAGQRLMEYSMATSLAFDLTRGVTNALIILLIGLPLLRALRYVTGAVPSSAPGPVNAPPQVHPDAVRRRDRSAQLAHLWTPSTTSQEN